MKVKVSLAMLVRMENTVNVEVPEDFESWSDFKKTHFMNDLYERLDENDFSLDDSWGCEEGTHCILGQYEGVEPVRFKLNENGQIEQL